MTIIPNQNSLFQKIEQVRRRQGKVRDTHINLAHGSGGKAMRDLIDDVFVKTFNNPILAQLEDQATIDLASLSQHGNKLAFTTDSYVVDPLFFPGSDIGELAI
ncbi:hydrogenase expression/formation protein HypE, partial [Dolichospermum sp. ST_sed5]|nr:hydrogenase expression/formation protein HypE [Dolichospermum sp. ST_sed5]